MPAQKNLRDVYLEELRDLWSANDQMNAVVNDLLRLDKLSYDIHMVAKGMLQRGMIDVEASGSVGIGSAAHRSGQAIAAWRATGGSGTSAKGEPNLGRAVAADVDIRRATQPAWCTPHGSAAAVGRE